MLEVKPTGHGGPPEVAKMSVKRIPLSYCLWQHVRDDVT